MKAPYQPPRLVAAGSFAQVTKGQWGWGHDYFYRRFAGAGAFVGGGGGGGGGFIAGGVVF